MTNNFTPLGGKSRNFKNTKTGEIISRRQYDKRFGSLAKTGFKTYEDKARAAKIIDERAQLLRPARGRKSVNIVGKSPAEIEHEIVERKIKKETHHITTPDPKKLKLQRGRKSATMTCDWSYGEIKKVINGVNKLSDKKVFAYLIGAVCIDDSGNTRNVSLLPYTFFQDSFAKDEWEEMRDKLSLLHYGTGLTPINAWIRISFLESYAMEHAIKIPTRKKRINAKKAPTVVSTKKRKK